MRASNIPSPLPASFLIIGLDNIAGLFGRTRETIRRWRQKEGFPIARLPDGTWFTTVTLIDEWCIARNQLDPYVTGEDTPWSYTSREKFLLRKTVAEMDPSEALAILREFETVPLRKQAAE
jgi:hypothetical protein